jgi:16S rRNA processing protein RimM
MKREQPAPDFLAIAQIVAPHGVSGEVRAIILTDFPDRFAELEQVYLGEEARPVTLEGYRMHRGQILLRLAGYLTRTQAEELRECLVLVPLAEAVALPEDAYYAYQIIGLEAWTEDGACLGQVTDVLETGANDVYVVKSDDGGEVLLPALESVVLKIDLEGGRLLVRLPPGLT